MKHFLAFLDPQAFLAATAQAASSIDSATQNISTADVQMILGGLLIVVGIVVAFCLIIFISLWRIFKKAGMPGWASLIPIYSSVKMLQMSNAPLWWVLLLLIPVVNIVVTVIMVHRAVVVFGRGWGFTIGMLLLPFIFYPILAFGSARYNNTYPQARAMSEAARWTLIGTGAFFLAEILYLVVGLSGQVSALHPSPLVLIGYDGNGDTSYVTDGNYVYYQDVPIYGADPSTFRMEGEYAKDDRGVYYAGTLVKDADAATFSSVLEDSPYSMDASHVYVDGSPLEGVDRATFTSLGYGYAKDSTHIYAYDEPLLDADLATFVVEYGTLGKDLSYDARDKNHYYLYGDVVKNTNSTSGSLNTLTWKKYTTTEFSPNFSVSYPSSWQVDNSSENIETLILNAPEPSDVGVSIDDFDGTISDWREWNKSHSMSQEKSITIDGIAGYIVRNQNKANIFLLVHGKEVGFSITTNQFNSSEVQGIINSLNIIE